MPTRGRRHQQGDLAGQQVARPAPRTPLPPFQGPGGARRRTASGGGGRAPGGRRQLCPCLRRVRRRDPLTNCRPASPPLGAGSPPWWAPAHPVTFGCTEPPTQTCPDLSGRRHPQGLTRADSPRTRCHRTPGWCGLPGPRQHGPSWSVDACGLQGSAVPAGTQLVPHPSFLQCPAAPVAPDKDETHLDNVPC